MKKLRHKVTGEIAVFAGVEIKDDRVFFRFEDERGIFKMKVNSLDELNEWEDVPEEPKGCWIINIFGVVEYTHFRNEAEAELLKEIGNYFETEEEAEKVAEKRKAWTRLEAKGFKFTGWSINPGVPGGYRITAFDQWTHETKDFDLLFGGEK